MKPLLKIERSLVTATVATFALTLPLAAQSGSRPDPRRTAPETAPATSAAQEWSPRLVRHDEIVGKTVRAGSSYGSTDGSSAGDEPTELGEITDLVIHREDGSIRYAILTPASSLEIGEEPRLVPWNKLRCGEKNAMTIADRKALGTMTKFDPENPAKSIRMADDAEREREGVATTEAGTRRGGRATEADAAASQDKSKHECLMATEAGSWTVKAKDQELGEIEALFVEVGHGTVGFAVIGTGGVIGLGETERPIPWNAISWTMPKDDEDAAPRVNLTKTSKQLESSPQLGDEGVDLSKADHRQKVYDYFGVDKPKFETSPPKKDKGDDGRSRR